MADCRITHIRKPNRQSSTEHITHVGNPPSWIWPRGDVIASISSATNTFYVLENGKRSEVSIVKPADGRTPFLRTHADGYYNDNLLSLPEC